MFGSVFNDGRNGRLLLDETTMNRMTATDVEVNLAFNEDYQVWLDSLPAAEREQVIAERKAKIDRMKISLPLAILQAKKILKGESL